MHTHSLSLQMSQIIAADAPLLSPTDACWDAREDAFAYYQLPPSPPLSDEPPSPALPTRMLRAPLSPDACLPTHQLFDIHRPPTPPSREPSELPPPPDPRKRSASPSPGAPKRSRAVADRISSKDFVPPDVSGLSKREARLVKNRAAAFLSRQRKREEFECMEIRVAELEQENARLLSLAGGATAPPADNAEIEQLRARLAAAEERERSLSARLASTAAPPVKLEAHEPFLFPRPQNRSGASLGLMVLLCALPSLLSVRSPPMPTAFSVPAPFLAASPHFDYPAFLPEYDWSPTGMHTIRFAPDDDNLADLAELAVSFEASPADARTIRVRIHSPASDHSVPPPPAAPWDTDPFLGGPFASDGSLHFDYSSAQPVHHQFPYQAPLQPPSAPPLVFGSGLEMDFGLGGLEFKLGPDSHPAPLPRSSQRVRIAMKCAPAAPGEGGEWEVSLC